MVTAPIKKKLERKMSANVFWLFCFWSQQYNYTKRAVMRKESQIWMLFMRNYELCKSALLSEIWLNCLVPTAM